MRIIMPMLLGTPWWVYLLWGYVLYVGAQASKTRIVPLWQLFVMPSIFALWYIANIYHASNLAFFCSFIWAGTTMIGIVSGILLGMQRTVKADHKNHLVKLSGTWSLLVILLIIFSIKYYFGYACAASPTEELCLIYKMQSLLFSTYTSNLFLAHTLTIVYKYHKAQSIALQ